MSVTNRPFYNFSNVVDSANTEPWRPLTTKNKLYEKLEGWFWSVYVGDGDGRLRYSPMCVPRESESMHSEAKYQIRAQSLSLLCFIILLLY